MGLFFGIIATLFDWKRMKSAGDLPLPETSNPTEIHTALTFGAIFVIVLFCSAWLSDVAGSKGLYIVALVSGLTDVDAIALSSLRLFNLEKLTSVQTATSISLAFISNMVFKFGLATFIGGTALARHIVFGFLAISSGIALGLVLFL
jgi:uncharacterized membrane protein (DUF4010 family)